LGLSKKFAGFPFLLIARVLFVSEFKKKQPGNGNSAETAGAYSLNLQKKCFGHKKLFPFQILPVIYKIVVCQPLVFFLRP